MLVGLRQLLFKACHFDSEFVDEPHLWVYVLDRFVGDKRGFHRVIQSAVVFFSVCVVGRKAGHH